LFFFDDTLAGRPSSFYTSLDPEVKTAMDRHIRRMRCKWNCKVVKALLITFTGLDMGEKSVSGWEGGVVFFCSKRPVERYLSSVMNHGW
jgi:hypothetical protein